MTNDARPWTISVTYLVKGDQGKQFRARSIIQVVAPDLPSAYIEAEKANIPGVKLGAIIPGHHRIVP